MFFSVRLFDISLNRISFCFLFSLALRWRLCNICSGIFFLFHSVCSFRVCFETRFGWQKSQLLCVFEFQTVWGMCCPQFLSAIYSCLFVSMLKWPIVLSIWHWICFLDLTYYCHNDSSVVAVLFFGLCFSNRIVFHMIFDLTLVSHVSPIWFCGYFEQMTSLVFFFFRYASRWRHFMTHIELNKIHHNTVIRIISKTEKKWWNSTIKQRETFKLRWIRLAKNIKT